MLWAVTNKKRVLGLRLPRRMVWLIANNQWKLADTAKLADVAGFSRGEFQIELMPPDGIRRETRAARRIARSSMAELYGLQPALKFWKRVPDDELLDTSRCLFLVVTMDENVVALDYRNSVPCVRASYESERGIKHKMIADSFDSFADLIGLPEPEQ